MEGSFIESMIQSMTDMEQNRIDLLRSIGKPKVGWLSIYTPEEIFHAAGIIPFRITGEKGIRMSDATPFLSNNFCSYVLSCLSEGIAGVYDFADGIVFVDACDMRKRLHEVWVHNLRPKYNFFLELPKDINYLSRQYFRLQIRNLIQSLEENFKVKITENALHEAISFYNESRRLLQKLYDFRKRIDPSITGCQAMQIMKASTSGLREEFNQKLSSLLSAIEAQPKGESKKKPRVLICGSYFDNFNIVSAIEKFGANVVCEDISNGFKYIEGQIPQNTDPVNAIADYYLEKSSCARVIDTEQRFNHLMNLVTEYRADSIIYFSLKFCDTNLMDFPYIRNRLLQNNIPVLFIEGEQHMTNIEYIKTRLLTFLETSIM